jgi:hypothetical protein
MNWEALASAAIGAILALSGTLVADRRRDGRLRDRDRDLERRRYCVEYTVALAEALGRLRQVVGRAPDAGARRAAAAEAMEPVHIVREQVLVSGTADLLVASEAAFHRLVDVRDVIRAGAELDSVAFHDAYHGFSDALWRFRLAVRADLHEPALAAADLDRPDWTDRDRCAVCQARS